MKILLLQDIHLTAQDGLQGHYTFNSGKIIDLSVNGYNEIGYDLERKNQIE